MIDDDLPARYRNAWREAYAEERARTAAVRRRFAAVVTVGLAGAAFLMLAVELLWFALADSPRADLAFAIITGLRK